MFKQFSRFWYVATALFTLNQLLEKIGVHIKYVHAYLDDFLAPTIVMGIALFVQQNWIYKNSKYVFPISYGIFFVIWYSFLFEFLFPMLDSRHHSDPWDILAYSIGTFIYYRLANKECVLLRSRNKT